MDNSAGIIFRKARVFDISKMHAIEKASFPTPWSFDALFADAFLNGNTIYLVAEYCKDITAYGGMWLVLDEAHITNIAVKQDCRRMGIADKLLSYLVEMAVKNGATTMILEVRTSNSPALALYHKHGFHEVGIRKGYYSNPVEDAFIMSKELVT